MQLSKFHWKEISKKVLLPFFILTIISILLTFIFIFFIGEKSSSPLLFESKTEKGFVSDPNRMRFLFLFIGPILSFILAKYSLKSKNKEKSLYLSFASGSILWQVIGESSQHFGYGIEGSFFFFPTIEGIGGTFILIWIIPFLIYLSRKQNLPFAIWVVILTFMFNWLGHYLIFATYYGQMSLSSWSAIVGLSIGIPLLLIILYYTLHKAKERNFLYCSLALYFALGMIIFSLIA